MLGAQEGNSPLEEQLLPRFTPCPENGREEPPWTELVQDWPPRAPSGLAGAAPAGKQQMAIVGSAATRVPPSAHPPAATFAAKAAGSRPRPRAHREPILLGPWMAPSARAPLLGFRGWEHWPGLWEPGLG